MDGRARRIVAGLIVTTVLTHAGCASTRQTSEAQLHAFHPRPEVVAVVSTGEPQVALRAATRSKGAGAARGAAVGATRGAAPGLLLATALACPEAICALLATGALGVAAAGAMVGGITGAIYGAAKAPSGADIAAMERAVADVADLPAFEARLRQRVADLTVSRTPVGVVLPKDTADVTTAADAVLNVQVDSLHFLPVERAVDPRLELVMMVHATLVHRGDDVESMRHVTGYRAGPRNLAEWAANGGREIRDALLFAADHVAADIVFVMLARGDASSPAPRAVP